MLPDLKKEEPDSSRDTPISMNKRIGQMPDKEVSLEGKSEMDSLAPSLSSIVVSKSKFLAKDKKDDVKIHLSCSEAMRQTQYNKLVTSVNKFDTQRIRKAIKEGKIRNLLRNEKDNPALMKTIKQGSLEKKKNVIRHIDSPDDSKILKARQKNKEIVSKTVLGETKFVPKFVKPVINMSMPDRSVEMRGDDSLTPFEMRILKEKLTVSSGKTK